MATKRAKFSEQVTGVQDGKGLKAVGTLPVHAAGQQSGQQEGGQQVQQCQ